MEEARYDPDGGQLLSATFMDYAMPRAMDLPPFEIAMVELPTQANPLGAKGVGQAGCIGAPQTVIHAVLDALRPLGVKHLEMPATPSRIWHAIQAAQKDKQRADRPAPPRRVTKMRGAAERRDLEHRAIRTRPA
jgi:carbon-monoxide dehydrogenase large subunit